VLAGVSPLTPAEKRSGMDTGKDVAAEVFYLERP